MLAGYGLGREAYRRPGAFSAGGNRWALGGLVVVLAVAAVSVRTRAGLEPLIGQVLYALLLLAAALLCVRGRQAPAHADHLWSLLTVALTLLDLFVVNFGINLASAEPTMSTEVVRVAQLVRADATVRAPGEPFRVRVQTDDHDVFPANYGHLVDVQQIGGDTPMMQRRLADLAEANNEWRLWELLNVRHTISRRRLDGALDDLGQQGQLRVYRNQWPVPRVWAVRDVRLADSPEEALRLALSPDVRPGFVTVLEEDPYLRFPSLERPEQSFRFLAYEPSNLVFEITLSADALVVASEAYYPGWRAFVDGEEVPIYRASYYLRAVPARAGTHIIEMRFDSVSLKVGAWISLLALAVCVAVLALGRLVRARPQAAVP